VTTSEPDSRRGRCYRCLRPERLCHCADLPTVPTRTRIVVLQHPHERTHPFGTARLVRLMLPNSEVHVPWSGFTGTLEQRLPLPADAAVLYPTPDAPLLDDLPRDRLPSTLVAIDGTWAHAKRLYRENGWLRDLPHVRLQPAQPSRYRIRREPRADYVSTLEAIVEALRVLEPEHARLDELLAAFDRMIDRQIAHAAVVERASGRRGRCRRCSPTRGSPSSTPSRRCRAAIRRRRGASCTGSPRAWTTTAPAASSRRWCSRANRRRSTTTSATWACRSPTSPTASPPPPPPRASRRGSAPARRSRHGRRRRWTGARRCCRAARRRLR
jgi:DTW domain-containing protein YfiP